MSAVITDPSLTLEWLLSPYTDTAAGELADSVVVALGTDRLANATDRLPDPDDTDRRGWWGDTEAEQLYDGWPIGCRLWLLSRESITGAAAKQGSTVARAISYTHEALQPYIDKRIATRVEVTGERIGLDRIDVIATMWRGDVSAVALRYSVLWDDLGQPPSFIPPAQFVPSEPPPVVDGGPLLDFSLDADSQYIGLI